MAFGRAYKPRRAKSSAASKSRSRAVSSKRRSDRVSRARRATITKIAKRAVLRTTERKYTPFYPVQSVTQAISTNNSGVARVEVLNDEIQIYPAQGDTEHTRDGTSYYLSYLQVQCMVEVTTSHRGKPLEVLLVRHKQFANLTTGNKNLEDLFPEMETNTAGVVVPKPAGRFHQNLGTVIARRWVWPYKQPLASTNAIYAATGTGSVSAQQDVLMFNIKVNKKFTEAGALAAFPHGLPEYSLVFIDHSYSNSTTNFNLLKIWTRCIFRDP